MKIFLPTFLFVLLFMQMLKLMSVAFVFARLIWNLCVHMYVNYYCLAICGEVYRVNSLQINTPREMDVLLRCQVAKQREL